MHTKIQIMIDGQKVEGEITHRSANNINVEIIKPYQNVSRGLHIPCFASLLKRFDSDLGDKIARDLLVNIYHLCAFIFENLDSLADEYLEFKKRIKFLEARHVSEIVFKSKRLHLRKLFKSGKIDSIEYQKRFTLIRREFKKFELKRSSVWSRFFVEYFPMIVPAGTRKDVLRILEKNTCAEHKNIKLFKQEVNNEREIQRRFQRG